MSKSCEVPDCTRMWADHFKGFAVCDSHLDPVIDWVREAAPPSNNLNYSTVAEIVKRRSGKHSPASQGRHAPTTSRRSLR